MPTLTASLAKTLTTDDRVSGWLRNRVAKPDGTGGSPARANNLTQVCNDQMTLSDMQQSFYWTTLSPADQDPFEVQ